MRDTIFSGRFDELTGSFLIKFDWWQVTPTGNRPPAEEILEELGDIATEHITAMRIEGYTEGELFHEMNGNTYRGYWQYQKY